MKRYILGILILLPLITSAQFSESLLHKIRYATDDYYLANDTLDITGSKTLPCLDIYINNKGPYRFLIDLGSNVLNFRRSLIKEANMDLVVDRGGRGDLAMAQKIEIGGSTFLNVHGAVYEDLGQDLDGVLGFNLLGKGDFFMDYPNLKFAFISSGDEIDSTKYTSYELLGRMPYVQSTINEKDYHINFDTGASGWLYFPLALKDSINLSKGPKPWKKSWNNQTGTTNSFVGQLSESIQFGDYLIKQPDIIFLPDIEDIFVGSSLLQQFKLTFLVYEKMVLMQSTSSDKEIIIPAIYEE